MARASTPDPISAAAALEVARQEQARLDRIVECLTSAASAETVIGESAARVTAAQAAATAAELDRDQRVTQAGISAQVAENAAGDRIGAATAAAETAEAHSIDRINAAKAATLAAEQASAASLAALVQTKTDREAEIADLTARRDELRSELALISQHALAP